MVISEAPSNTIGGTTAGARNVISGNNDGGVTILSSGSTGNLVQGNFIGTDVTGTADLGNSFGGVNIQSASSNTIGGTTAGARNVISGNNMNGVQIIISAAGNQVQGNFIGIDVNGTADLGNSLSGVRVDDASSNTIGGTTAGARNVISGNDGDGIFISNGAVRNQVQGNFIGADVTGTADVGNSQDGVRIFSAPTNTIGGTTPEARNVISGNGLYGVLIDGSGSTGNQVQGNFIGTDVTGTAALSNSSIGVYIFNNSSNAIGGTASGAGNTIAFNGSVAGVFVDSGTGNTVLSNSIFSNTGLGIDLNPVGVTPNDSGDGDTGANNLQNFPVLTSASSSGGSTTIGGTLNSTANTTFTLQFFSNSTCDPSGFGEGETFIGSTTVTTDDSGNASFTVTFPETLSPGAVVTATATDPSGNTSEFSQCITVEGETSCTYTILPQSALFPASGGPGFVNVAALPDCSWIAMSKDPTWIIVISGGGGTGSGVVNYNVLPNPNVEPRTGTLTIVGEDGSGNDHTVNQAGSPPQ